MNKVSCTRCGVAFSGGGELLDYVSCFVSPRPPAEDTLCPDCRHRFGSRVFKQRQTCRRFIVAQKLGVVK